MNELYVALSGAVVKAGTLVGVDDIDTFEQLLYRTPVVTVTLLDVPVAARDAFTAQAGTDTEYKFAWGQEDGTATPSGVGTDQMAVPTTRSWFRFSAWVRDVGTRTTDKGAALVLHLTLRSLVPVVVKV